jgi:cold-inducible RNA-binding protein
MKNKIYVGNLSFNADEDSVSQLFGEVGEISSVNIIKDKFSGRSKGFAFVEFTNEDSVDPAIEKFNGEEFLGRALRVSQAHDKPQGGRGGGGGGDRGGRRGGGGYGGGGGGFRGNR